MAWHSICICIGTWKHAAERFGFGWLALAGIMIDFHDLRRLQHTNIHSLNDINAFFLEYLGVLRFWTLGGPKRRYELRP